MRTSANLFTDNNLPTERLARLLKDLRLPYDTLTKIDDGLQVAFFQKKESGEARERWELETVIVECPESTIRSRLAELGFLTKTVPRQKHYDRAAWPGALVTRAAVRLFDLIEAWNSGVRWDEMVVFGGKRALIPEKESVTQCIKALRETGLITSEDDESFRRQWAWIDNPPTELDMMQWIWYCSVPTEMAASIRVNFVDAPIKPPVTEGGAPVRPNTEDTIIAWERDCSPSPGTMLVSSGAPYGMAQNEAFWMLLGPKEHSIETFGHAVPTGLGLEVILRELAGCVNRIRRARGV